MITGTVRIRGVERASAWAAVVLLAVAVALGAPNAASSSSQPISAALAELARFQGCGLVTEDRPARGARTMRAARIGGAHAERAFVAGAGNDKLQGPKLVEAPDPAGEVPAGELAVIQRLRQALSGGAVDIDALAGAVQVRRAVLRTAVEEPSRIPPGDRAALLADVGRWLDAADQQRALCAARHVPTIVSRAVAGLARVARATGTIGLIVGGAGVGKTSAAEALQDEIGGLVVYVRVGVDERVPRGFRRAIRRAISGSDYILSGTIRSERFWFDRLRSGGPALLLIDEAQRLDVWALEIVRDLTDGAAELGALLLGTRALGERVDAEADPSVGALASRIALKLDLDAEIIAPAVARGGWIDGPTVAEIIRRQTPAAFSAEALRTLTKIANTDAYRLRRAVQVARVAAHLAGSGTVGGEDVRAAVELRGDRGGEGHAC